MAAVGCMSLPHRTGTPASREEAFGRRQNQKPLIPHQLCYPHTCPNAQQLFPPLLQKEPTRFCFKSYGSKSRTPNQQNIVTPLTGIAENYKYKAGKSMSSLNIGRRRHRPWLEKKALSWVCLISPITKLSRVMVCNSVKVRSLGTKNWAMPFEVVIGEQTHPYQ